MFFSTTDRGLGFELLTWPHLFACIAFAVIPLLLVFFFSRRIKNSDKEKWIGLALALFTLAVEIGQYIWHYAGGETNWRHIYPTTLCGLSVYVTSFSLITRNEKLSSIAYFYSYGAVLSFLMADQTFGMDRFRYYSFFIIHGMILVNTAYLIWVRKTKIDRQSLIRALLVLFPILLLSYPANILFSNQESALNFFYVSYPPFEFPLFSDLYERIPTLYTLCVYLIYWVLTLLLYGLYLVKRRIRSQAI